MAKRGLYKAIISVSTVLTDNEALQQYFGQVLQPLQDRFKGIICHADFPRNYHQEEIRIQIVDILDSFIGQFKIKIIKN